jgi:acyl-ACP thioesterase
MAASVFSESYRITSYLVNLRGRAGLYGILNLIQDVGWQHAGELGFRFSEQDLAWVFTRQELRMNRWPAFNETVTLSTWLRPPKSVFIFRDYELFCGEEKVGECTSSFTLIDSRTRKLAAPDWSPFRGIWKEEGNLALNPRKLPLTQEGEDLAEFEVRNSDLDLNQHVNNTKYAQWILDAVPLSDLKSAELKGYEINFLAETRKGDRILVRRMGGEDEKRADFEGKRVSDGKVVFAASLSLGSLS